MNCCMCYRKIQESTMKSLLAFPMIKYTQGMDLSQLSSVLFRLFLFLVNNSYNALLLYFNICRTALRQSMVQWREKLGQTTIDLGIAPDKLIYQENGETKVIDPIDRLKSIKGLLVSFPLDFMREEDLRPAVIESEFYVAPQVYH